MTGQQSMPAVDVRAPAKINLGLEILGKRKDGYHEIRSVLAMIDLNDDLRVQRGAQRYGTSSVEGVPADLNLIDRAIQLFQARSITDARFSYQVTKRIPIAAGLGGASSDAAAVLSSVNHLLGHPLTHDQLSELAATLGSDVPFFLGDPVAFVEGTGTRITPVPAISSAVLLIVPNIAIPRKTATLYGLITTDDLSPGTRIDRTLRHLRAGLPPDQADLHNAFAAPLYTLVPSLAAVPAALRDSGCVRFGLSGAGPAHYALLCDSDVDIVEKRIRTALDPCLFGVARTSLLLRRPCLTPIS
ncbi:MAG: 4-diphosphocytidyl-2-C-methyl-D-erythritol kinase [uncultured Thermomicrobiales bacterium]|uniref:4-diphosphocytidyl-2-C-methyl-D-erythritol kinase n=1 Tax=uncultured Thermomicrobiales bacterium TaxID=1645740 RepID=A0A6J4UDS9_9BACT|nr:MAG: 4-diphosphocytidyl-2-C-methyl-D-erythritol kinase [uncultured Thermomicrobiales bacterium]